MGGNMKEVERLRDIVQNKPKRKMRFIGGRYNGKEVDTWVFVADDETWKFSAFPYLTPNREEIRNRGGLVPCAELDDMPRVNGYVGPMYDDGCLRYETQEMYDVFSV